MLGYKRLVQIIAIANRKSDTQSDHIEIRGFQRLPEVGRSPRLSTQADEPSLRQMVAKSSAALESLFFLHPHEIMPFQMRFSMPCSTLQSLLDPSIWLL